MFDVTKIRVIDDFPTPGIKFFDITTLLNDGEEYRKVLDDMLQVAIISMKTALTDLPEGERTPEGWGILHPDQVNALTSA